MIGDTTMKAGGSWTSGKELLNMNPSDRSPTQLLRSQHTESAISVFEKEEATDEGPGETLLVRTESPTQLQVHETCQDTQLIERDTQGFALEIHSDDEGSGNTEVLPDDSDSHCSGSGCEQDPETGFTVRDENCSDGNKTPPVIGISSASVLEGDKKLGRHLSSAERNNQRFNLSISRDDANQKTDLAAVPMKEKKPDELGAVVSGQREETVQNGLQESLDSDATTEEGDLENDGYSEAVAETTAHDDKGQIEDSFVCKSGSVSMHKLLKVVDPSSASSGKMSGEQHLIGPERSLHMLNMAQEKSKQAIRCEADIKGEPAVNEGSGAENEAHASQSLMETPKATLAARLISKDSPCSSTSRSRSRSIASVRAASLRAAGLRAAARNTSIGLVRNESADQNNSGATIELTSETAEVVPSYSKILKELTDPKTSFESLTPDSKSSKYQIAFLSHPKHVDVRVALTTNGIGEEVGAAGGQGQLNGHLRQPSGQKVRKLFCDVEEKPEKLPGSQPENSIAANKDEGSDKPVTNSLQMGIIGPSYAAENNKAELTDVLGGERLRNPKHHGSLAPGLFSTSTNLSYMESQEPGEESQLNALNMVDKLLWLNATGTSQDTGPNMAPEQPCVKGSQSAKGVQSLAHTAEAKNRQDQMGVYDWVDSQHDEAGLSSDIKEVSGPPRSHKKGLEAPKMIKGRQRQTGSQQHRGRSGLQSGNKRSGYTVGKKKVEALPFTGERGAPKVKSLTDSKLVVNRNKVPGDLLSAQVRNKVLGDLSSAQVRNKVLGDLSSAQVRNSNKAGSRQTRNSQRVSNLANVPHENVEQKEPVEEANKSIEHIASNSMQHSSRRKHIDERMDQKLKDATYHFNKCEKESVRTSDIGSDTQIAVEAMEMMSHGLVTNKVLVENQGKEVDQGEGKLHETETHKGGNGHATNLRKRSISLDDAGQVIKRQKASAGSTNHTMTLEPKGRKRVSWARDMEEQPQCIIGKGGITRKEESLKRGPKTRSKVDMQADALDAVGAGELCKAKYVRNKCVKKDAMKSKLKTERWKQEKTSLSSEHPMPAVSEALGQDSPVERKDGSKKRCVTRQQSVVNTGQHDAANDAIRNSKARIDSLAVPFSINETAGSNLDAAINPQTKSRDKKRKREVVSEKSFASIEAHKKQALPDFEVGGSKDQKGLLIDSVSQPILRRTRSSLDAPASTGRNTRKSKGLVFAQGQERKSDLDDQHEDAVGPCSDGQLAITEINNSRSRISRSSSHKDAVGERQLATPAMRTAKSSKGRAVRHTRKPDNSEAPTQLSSIFEEGRRRKREPGCIHVLFSHSLSEDNIKHQKKILAKLGGHVVTSAADCTHFVADSFVRTRNMLETMAAGKVVITSLWLESCGQASYFVDEKKYILQDAKKEKELGFSMHSSLASAQHKPILKGMKVLLSPNTTPEPEAMAAIIEAAGGQAVHKFLAPSKMDASDNDPLFAVIACEKDYEFCLPHLERGVKVYSTELILSGIVVQNLDFSRHRLFEDSVQHKRASKRAANLQK